MREKQHETSLTVTVLAISCFHLDRMVHLQRVSKREEKRRKEGEKGKVKRNRHVNQEHADRKDDHRCLRSTCMCVGLEREREAGKGERWSTRCVQNG